MPRYSKCKSEHCRRVAFPGRDGYCDVCYKLVMEKNQLELLKQISADLNKLNKLLLSGARAEVTQTDNQINVIEDTNDIFIPTIEIDDTKSNITLENQQQTIIKDLSNIVTKLKNMEEK